MYILNYSNLTYLYGNERPENINSDRITDNNDATLIITTAQATIGAAAGAVGIPFIIALESLKQRIN